MGRFSMETPIIGLARTFRLFGVRICCRLIPSPQFSGEAPEYVRYAAQALQQRTLRRWPATIRTRGLLSA